LPACPRQQLVFTFPARRLNLFDGGHPEQPLPVAPVNPALCMDLPFEVQIGPA